MARVMCRCGETLKVSSADPDRVTCPKCGTKIRVRRNAVAKPGAGNGDGFIRFHCPCGRRLKVRESDGTEAGKCPDCGRIVPVPDGTGPSPAPAGNQARSTAGPAGASSRTEDMDAIDLDRLERWPRRVAPNSNQPAEPFAGEAATSSHQALRAVPGPDAAPAQAVSSTKMEAGLRVCPRCGKPLHMSATVCRSCGEPVPKR